MRMLVALGAIGFGIAVLLPTRPALATAREPERNPVFLGAAAEPPAPAQPILDRPPAQTPTPPPEPNPITQIINQIIQFPFENLSDALQNAAKSILNGTVTPLESFFSASIGRWLTSSPGIITPGGGIANGEDAMGPAWRLMVKVAVLMWPVTLAILAAMAAKDAVAAASWGVGDLKETLSSWLIAVIGSATSLYWMDLTNRFTNATTMAILNMSFTGEAGFQPNALTALVFGTAALLLTMVSLPASLIIVVFVILMGLAVLSALIFQFLARFVILYLLVALAPVVIILGVLPPLGWFRAMWLRGFVMVEAIGPINALLLKLVMILAGRGASNDPVTAFVDFIGAIGVLSILLTVDGVIIKGVFGAAQEVMQKAVGTVQALGALALAGITALAGGSIAAGAMGAGGVATASGTGGGGSGSLTDGANVVRSGTGTAPQPASRTGSPASIARRAFDPGAALRGAGDILYRQPGMLGSVGAAMRALGGTVERSEREQQAESRWQAGQMERTASREEQKARWEASQAQGQAWRDEQRARWNNQGRPGGARGTGPNGGGTPTAPAGPTTPGGHGPGQGGRPIPPSPTTSNLAPTVSAATGSMDDRNRISNASLPANNQDEVQATAARTAPPNATGHPEHPQQGTGTGVPTNSAALPPAQMPSVSPMGSPIALNSLPSTSLAPEAARVVELLPAPLSERAGTLASLYSDPRQQATAARAAVEAFNQVNARGQGLDDIGWQGNAWDRSMAPVVASARQGLALETMARDAGFGGNVSAYLADRMVDPARYEPRWQVPTQPVAWHPQMAPHDWEMGAAISNALGNHLSPGAAARVYHEIRSPETGGGWAAGVQFAHAVQNTLERPTSDPLAALGVQLAEMEMRGVVSARAMTLWRANARNQR